VAENGPNIRRSTPPPPIGDKPKVIAYGDSLTAGYGLGSWEDSFPAQLQKRLDADGYDLQVLNYGQGGDTASGGRARLDLALGVAGIRIFILELGANDVMKEAAPDEIKADLNEIIRRVKEKNIEILLCGFKPPPEVGSAYAADIERMYSDLAAENGISYMPDFMKGVRSDPELMMEDKIHPNKEGVRVIQENVYLALQPLLAKYERKKN